MVGTTNSKKLNVALRPSLGRDTMKHQMHSLLGALGNMRDLTYVGVGSAIHDLPGMTDKTDQIIPLFVKEMMCDNKKITAIHFDPMFKFDVMEEYFKKHYPMAEMRHLGYAWYWNFGLMEVYILPMAFEHKSRDPEDHDVDFMDALINRVLQSATGRLVFQQYTGYDPVATFKDLYAVTKRPADFKDRILFDVSYGSDTGCCTDMSRWKPIIAPHGGYMNFLLYDTYEMCSIIGFRPDVDTLIYGYFKKEYIQLVNDNHVNYRRRLRGDDCMFTVGLPYPANADPDVIMRYLIGEINKKMDIFRRLGYLSSENEIKLAELLLSYKPSQGVNVYDWYSAMTKIV